MTGPAGFAFKAYEIEELADVYFFRPLGMVFARAARALRLTPTIVTIVGAAIGMAGGALLVDNDLALAGFGLIIFHGILDSSDGQLARMTGQASEFGRALDGVAGYLTHVAIYAAIVFGSLARGANGSIVGWAVLAGAASAVHAQMYDYHRSAYARLAIDGIVEGASMRGRRARWLTAVLRIYEAAQSKLARSHVDVERLIAKRASNLVVRDTDRARYRSCFYWPVRGWNLLGDNTRFYAIGVLAWMQHLDWFFPFVLGPMNAAFVAVWLWQDRADRRFLAGL